jgi:hypothetical protein
MKSNLNRTLVIILIGNNLVNTVPRPWPRWWPPSISATSAPAWRSAHHPVAADFGEITPKTFGSRYAIVVACSRRRRWNFSASCSCRWSGRWKPSSMDAQPDQPAKGSQRHRSELIAWPSMAPRKDRSRPANTR